MSDQSFHEIQLSGKQLVFLFMCAVVLTVVVFLFGVSVGREVRSPTATTASAPAPTDTNVPAETPPPTQPAPNELSYAQALQGRDGEDPSKVVPPAPAPEEPPATVAAKKAAPPAQPPAKKTDMATPPVTPAAAPPPAATPPAPAAKTPRAQDAPAKPAPAPGGFFVQVAVYSADNIAGKEVAKLQGKGYPAFVFTEAENTPGPRYKVRVGPYAARAQADQMLKSLTKAGYKPLIKR